MEESIFAIEIHNSSGKLIDNGTGFIINNEGYFISAGHVFEIKSNKFFARIQNDLLPINLLHDEYMEQDKQVPPYYKDLVVGKVCLGTLEIQPLKFSDSIDVNNSYKACGYSTIFLNNDVDTEMTWDDLFDDNEEILKYNELSFPVTEDFTFRTFNGNYIQFDNGFSIDMNETPAKGLSGGPLLEQKQIKGMLIAVDNCIKAEYIIKILDGMNIKYSIS